MGANDQTYTLTAVVPKVIPIDSEPVRSDLAQILDSAYEAVNSAAKAFMARRNGKVAARLALVSLAVVAATNDTEWQAMHLHTSDEAAVSLLRACQAAHSAIELLLLAQPDGENRLKGNAVVNCLRAAMLKAETAGVR